MCVAEASADARGDCYDVSRIWQKERLMYIHDTKVAILVAISGAMLALIAYIVVQSLTERRRATGRAA